MRFQQFINEDITDRATIQETLELLFRDCTPFLKIAVRKNSMKQLWLYSGRKSERMTYKGTVRTDRQPRDTTPELHKFIDDRINEKFGIRFRSNSIFCYGNPAFSGAYGETFMIFPIGKFDYLWTHAAKDLYMSLIGRDPVDMIEELNYIIDRYQMNKEYEKAVMLGDREVMVHCNTYYAVHYRLYEYYLNQYFNDWGLTPPTEETLSKTFGTGKKLLVGLYK